MTFSAPLGHESIVGSAGQINRLPSSFGSGCVLVSKAMHAPSTRQPSSLTDSCRYSPSGHGRYAIIGHTARGGEVVPTKFLSSNLLSSNLSSGARYLSLYSSNVCWTFLCALSSSSMPSCPKNRSAMSRHTAGIDALSADPTDWLRQYFPHPSMVPSQQDNSPFESASLSAMVLSDLSTLSRWSSGINL